VMIPPTIQHSRMLYAVMPSAMQNATASAHEMIFNCVP